MPNMNEARAVAARNREHLQNYPNVISVGYGFKRSGGRLTDIPSVVVFVKEKKPLSALTARDAIPPSVEAGMPIVEVPTDVVVIRTVDALVFHPVNSEFRRPCPGGYSIGHSLVTAGTLGLPVVMKDGKKALLTNAHVAAPHWLGDVKVGDPIYQPGPYDGGKPENSIAILHSWIPIDAHMPNKVDCALALIDDNKVKWQIEGIEAIYSALADTEPGQLVKKVGRTTGLTTGRIVTVGAAINVNYGSFTALFLDQLEITSIDDTFSKGGDSGSAILSDTGRDVFGLLFAGDSVSTYANRIANVQAELQFSLNTPVTIEQQLRKLIDDNVLLTVWGYNAGAWYIFNPRAPAQVNTLKVLEKGLGYWINVETACPLAYKSFVHRLNAGWNLIGWQD